MKQDDVLHELQFIIDSTTRINKNFDKMLHGPALHPNTVAVIGALKEYFGPLEAHLSRTTKAVLENFTALNVENCRLREVLRKQCECGALPPDNQCEGCSLLEEIERCEKK